MTRGRIEIISASAGSGKTTRLAGELERAVVELGVAPDRIVATTFTRKAAAELVERGRRALLRASRHEDAELFRASRIGTVNAVAGMIVSDFAFEAGVSPELIVLDDARAQEAFRRSLGEVVTRDDLDDLARLAGRFEELPWQDIVRQIADAARTNRVALEALDRDCENSVCGFLELLDPPAGPAATLDAGLEAALAGAIDALRARIEGGADRTKKTAELLELYERALHRMRALGALPWPEWARLLGETAASKTDPLCEGVRRAARALIGHPELREDCELAVRLCFGLARRALAAYQRWKRARRAIDFVDQETLALDLLDRPDVQEVLSAEISLVLVDEFQDVSPLQLALFLALARVAPRSVWVGDQKQAIYGFRGADPALMEAVVSEILGDEEPETLGVGRRSRAPLVHLTNALFVPPFRDAGLPASRVALEPSSPDDPARGPAVERWRLDGRNVAEDVASLALLVRHLLDDPTVRVRDREDGALRRLRRGDVAILCRRRNTCLAVAAALADLHVPSQVARGGLLATPEGRALSAALRVWVDPEDALARAELVRSADPGAPALDALLDAASADRWSDAEPVARVLAARAAAPFAGALEAFDAAVDAVRLDDLAARWGRGRQGIANLDALRSHAVSFVRLARHRGGAASPAALAAHLAALAHDTEDSQAIAGGGDAVEISTWHAAKGLEWPIVVLHELDLAFPHTALGVHVDDRRGAALRLDAPLAGRTVRYWPSPFPAQGRTPFHERLRRHELTAELTGAAEREALRLLYVGWTRARDRLALASRRDLSAGILGLLTRGGAPLAEPPPAGPGVMEARLRWAGLDVSVAVRRPTPPATPPPTCTSPPVEVPLRPAPRAYAPAHLRPSDLDRRGALGHLDRIGPAISLLAGADPIALGVAVHAFLATDHPGLDGADRAEIGARLLAAWGVDRALALDDLLALSDHFSQWLAACWPGARIHREWPIEHRLEAGQLVRGKVDVLVEAPGSLVILDHKVLATGEARALEEAAGYAGQLGAYAAALAAAGQGREVEVMIHLPLSGLVARVV